MFTVTLLQHLYPPQLSKQNEELLLMQRSKNALHLSAELHHADTVGSPCFLSATLPVSCFRKPPPIPGIVVDSVLLCLGVGIAPAFYVRCLLSIVRWKKKKALRRATREPRQMAVSANGSMWNTFLLSGPVIPVLSVIVGATRRGDFLLVASVTSSHSSARDVRLNRSVG